MVPRVVTIAGEIFGGRSNQMSDNTQPPAAQRWRALAEDSYTLAETLTDAEAKATMRQIALGYEHMALNAERREASPRPVMMSETAPEPGTA